MSTIAAVIGRILLAIIFIESGIFKLMHVAATEKEILSVGLPSGLAIPTGVFELVAGLCLVFGLMTRLVSILLAGFIALTILFFHNNFTDPMQATIALMHVAMIGGMFMVFAQSQMWWGWDKMRAQRNGEVAARRAELDAREAELRAARAEGAAEAARTGPAQTQTYVDRPIVGQPVVAGAPRDTVVTDVDRDGVPEVRRRKWF
jgi:putative oxidoreductase